jgi:hypothetical protein
LPEAIACPEFLGSPDEFAVHQLGTLVVVLVVVSVVLLQ